MKRNLTLLFCLTFVLVALSACGLRCCRVDSRSGGDPGSDANSYSDSRSHSCPNSSGDTDSPSDAHSRTDPGGDTGSDAHSCTVQSSASYKESNR